MAHLAGQVEQHLLAAHQVVHGVAAHVGDVDADLVLVAGEVEEVAAVVGEQAVHGQHLRPEVGQGAAEVGADEPERAGDHDLPAAVEVEVVHLRAASDWIRRGSVGGRGKAGAFCFRCSLRTTSSSQRLHEVGQGARHAGDVEELALAVGAVEVVHGHLGDAEAVVLHLLHELHADDARGAGERDLLEDGAAHEAEVAVHVAQAQPEHRPHERVVEPPDDACGGRGRSARSCSRSRSPPRG